MALYKIKDFDPDYVKHMNDRDLKGLDVYTGTEKVGSVNDLMVDENGQFRYFIVDTGGWLGGKKVLLPIGRARVDYDPDRVYADNLTKAQAESLPEFTEDLRIDYDHEEQVRGVYRPDRSTQQRNTATTGSIGTSSTERTPAIASSEPMLALEDEYAEIEGEYVYDRNTYQHEREPDLYQVNEQNHPSFKLYEERLVTSKTRQKTGEAVISKRIETETAQASVPVEKERVVIEHVPGNAATPVAPGVATFQAGEVSRVEVYEEVPEFHKEAFVREEVRVNKVVEQENVTVQDTIRREELAVDSEGNPVVKQNPN
ncbi:DUF2382 domain-containing protein [Chamaesiphon sp.]|uniref:DUF2382 domain-containing protein n=1 Tax=Chamaesiphon sp. TaxID=2814140 RepID=UPI00359421F1